MRLSQAVAPAALSDASSALPSAAGGGTGTALVTSFVAAFPHLPALPAEARERAASISIAVESQLSGERS